jgi:hypothetical protein
VPAAYAPVREPVVALTSERNAPVAPTPPEPIGHDRNAVEPQRAETPAQFPAIDTRGTAEQAPHAEVAAPARVSEVAHVVEKTFRAAERIRASGDSRLEVAVRLESGQRVAIELRVANGEVLPIIRTESESFRQTLQQHWSQFAQTAERGVVRVTTPVFESPQTSSNMADLSHQGRHHQRTFHDLAPEFLPTPNWRTPARPEAVRAPEPVAPASGIRHYA